MTLTSHVKLAIAALATRSRLDITLTTRSLSGCALLFTAAAHAQVLEFNIPAQSLDRALREFADQSGLQMLYNPSDVEHLSGNEVIGRMSPDSAIRQLLQETGLVYEINGDKITFRPAAVLAAVRVQDTELQERTEGTGSYTTRSMSTATKLNLSIRETPQSISVVTRQQIEDQNVTTIGALLQHSVGVNLGQYGTDLAAVTARGFGVSRHLYDGMTTGSPSQRQMIASTSINFDTAFYDRIEVVRGATGLTIGIGDPSAAINFVRKRPTAEFQAHAQIGAGSWDSYRSELDVSGPLALEGRIRGRVVGAYSDGESYLDYLHRKVYGVYGIVEADLTSDLLLTVSATHDDKSNKGVTSHGTIPYFYADGTPTNFSRSTTTAVPWTSEDVNAPTVFAQLEKTFANDWTARVQYTYSKVDRTSSYTEIWGYPETDSGAGMDIFPYDMGYNSQQDAIEIQIGGPLKLFAREHELMLGYGDTQTTASQIVSYPSSYPALESFYDIETYPKPAVYDALDYHHDNEWHEESFFLSSRWQLVDRLKMAAGVRVTNAKYDERRLHNETSTGYRIRGETTPYIGLIYGITDNVSAYASYTSIFQPQTVRDIDNNLLDPIVGNSYEGGIKAELHQGRTNLSASIFKTEQDNYPKFDSYVGSDARYRAIKGAKVSGFELEAAGEILSGWSVAAGYTHWTGKDANGDPHAYWIPNNLLRLSSSWQLPGVLRSLRIGGHINWQNGFYEPAIGPDGEDGVQGSYGTIDLFATWQTSQQLSIQANVDNILDEKYYSNISNIWGMYGPPRNFTVVARYSF